MTQPGSLLSPAAAAGTGSVTNVTGVAPIASSGGDTPAISYNGGTIAMTAGTLSFASGSNKRIGSGTLVGGTLAVANTSVTVNSIIFVQSIGGGTVANLGALYIASQTASTGFTVTSTNALDNNHFKYLIVEAA